MEIIRRFYDWKNKGEFPKEYYTCMEGLQIHLLTGKAAIALEELRNTDSDQYKKTIQAVFIDKGDPGYKVIHNKQQLIPFAYETLDFIRQQQQNSLYGEVESLLKNPIFASLEEQKQKDVVTKNNDFETLYQNAGRCWSFYLQTRKDWEMASPENRAEAENRLSEAAQAADDSFRKALFFATPQAPASDVDKLRFQWASLCLLNKRYEDAIVLSEYLIQGNPDFEFLLETASVNLHAWYQIYNETKKESVSHTEIPEIIAHIQKCVDFMAERWGNEQAGNMSNLVQEALMIQIEMAIEEGRTQEAESLLSRIPENSLQRATAEMRLGRSRWNTYTILINQEIPPTADPENAASNGNPKKNDTDSPAVTNSANGVEEEPSSPTDKTAESEKEDNTSKTENLPESPENTGNSELANSKSTNPATEKTDSSETISDTPENREKLLTEAQKMLETGLTRKLTAGNVEPTDLQAIYSALSLAQIYMAQNDTENADKWMSHPVIGPYIRVNALLTSSGEETENATGTVLEPDFQMATMELMLRILVRQKKFDQAEQLMQTLESIADSGKESVRLTTVYLQLGKQIEEQIRSLSEAARRGDKAKQQELDDVSQGFETFLKRISVQEEGNTYQTLYWVADTFFCLAQGLGGNVSKPSPQVISYYESAGRTYQAILKKIELDPSWAPGFAETQTTIRLAECLRATNRFNNAVKILIPLLQKNSNLVEVQIEAAKTYQAWGLVNREYYLRAIQGAEPQADGQNLIWGWNGLISRLARSLNGNSPDKNQRTLNDMFYTACYN
ncbi:MAG: hypothetical protein IKW74_00215, partial [Thermoguttaceae bacterium]|nr:hypothetical protein [Thermoguttaceae bacterium]